MSKNATEISDAEWQSRKLSKSGYLSAMLDLVLLTCYFTAAIVIGSSIISKFNDPAEIYVCWLVAAIFVILGMKICLRLVNIRTEYQTIILREDLNDPIH